MYKKREKIYPREVHGMFARLRVLGVFALLGPYYLLPWIQWNGRQSVLFDLPARKFHIFGLTFWPQDFFYLAVLLIVAALSLFFFTALAGRLWCGYACPQTVWTEVFLWIERKVEGNRNQQIKLDKSEWSSQKALRKGTKHLLWILFSLWTGFTFVGYFTPIRELAHSVATFSTGPWETFWILFYSLATYGNAGWLREQVCLYMCPYARFQSAMFDKDTLIISYDEKRGEPRGGRKRGVDPAEVNLGDCIDCKQCVQVCPTGIDIRDGLQYQCIGCAACIDICDEVMEKMGYEKGLIRYTTEHAMKGNKTHILRPRVIFYALVLLTLISGLMYSILTRVPLELDIIRDRNGLYRENSEGLIENVYTLKVVNMDEKPHHYTISATGLKDLTIQGAENVNVDSGKVADVVVKLATDPRNIPAVSNKIEFHIQAEDNPELKQDQTARFLGPRK
ncbi:MAG TPA: cytochrome c oxidase accessory protein CcoG [Gammaproteobacteria bacterium]|nr:cytochrome c oxidase accessory protein CcoG [Gammaproteobacteria bacterium]